MQYKWSNAFPDIPRNTEETYQKLGQIFLPCDTKLRNLQRIEIIFLRISAINWQKFGKTLPEKFQNLMEIRIDFVWKSTKNPGKISLEFYKKIRRIRKIQSERGIAFLHNIDTFCFPSHSVSTQRSDIAVLAPLKHFYNFFVTAILFSTFQGGYSLI